MADLLEGSHLGAVTEAEIRTSTEIWRVIAGATRTAVDDIVQAIRGREVVFLGCGSSHIVGRIGAALLDGAGLTAGAAVSSDFVLRPMRSRRGDDGRAAVVISRSGETSESISALRAFKRRSAGPVVTLTCRPGSTLAAESDAVVNLAEADERAVPQTRSVAAAVVALLQIAAAVRGEDIRADIEYAADRVDGCTSALWDALTAVAHTAQAHVLLGSGLGYAIAQEGALKLVEMGRAAAWAHRTLEYRHGPLESLDGSHALLGPLGVDVAAVEAASAATMSAYAGGYLNPNALLPALPGATATLAQLYFVHAYALLVSRRAGRDADRPTQIEAHVGDVWLED